MKLSIKVRHRSHDGTPWKWEMRADNSLITGSHDSFATQSEAHRAGRIAMARFKNNLPKPRTDD